MGIMQRENNNKKDRRKRIINQTELITITISINFHQLHYNTSKR